MEIQIGVILVGLLGGLAIFLHGMNRMTRALKLVAGDRMKGLLARMTTNRFKGVFTGAVVTALVQSSSVTTVLVVGFVSAGLLGLSQSVGIIMGASIGTTITAQIVAFKVTKFALVLVSVGFGVELLSRNHVRQQYGKMVMGLGLIFFGMQLMKEATGPLNEYQPFLELLKDLDDPFLAIVFSALLTALIQSSSATTGVIIVLASQGFLTLESGIALVFGANVGTCITAVLASIGKPRDAVRAAAVHVLFNVAGVLVWMGLIDQLADIVRFVSPSAEGLEGIARLKAESPRQIANAHTIFNVSNTILFIGFAPLIARFVQWLVPGRHIGVVQRGRRTGLDDILVHTPALALDLVRSDLRELGEATLNMVEGAGTQVLDGHAEELDALRALDDEVDHLYGNLITYLGRLSLEPLSAPQSHRLSQYMAAANNFESIGDMVKANLVDAGKLRVSGDLEVSTTTRDALRDLHAVVEKCVRLAIEAIASDDRDLANEVLESKGEITRVAANVEVHLSRRLAVDEPNRLAVYRLETTIVEALRRIYYFAKRIAKLVVDQDGWHERSDENAEAN